MSPARPTKPWRRNRLSTPTLSRHQSISTNTRLAILTTAQRNSFRGNLQNFADLIRVGRRMGVSVYVVTTSAMANLSAATITGFTLNSQNRWQKATFPWPNVIYNRIPNRDLEQQPHTQKVLQNLQNQPQIHLFNPSFFNKWHLYQQLSQSPLCRSYLPETMMFSQSSLINMLRKYSTIMLKESEGKAGIGMMRVQCHNQGYELCYQGQKQKRYLLSDQEQLIRQVNRLCGSKSYLIQPTIPLATFRGRPFDIRILMQRNRQGEWTVAGIGTRVAGTQALSTHVPRGGQIQRLQTVLQHAFPQQHQQLPKQLKKIGLQFAKEIESAQKATLGELSLDIGIESSQKFWFFEANAKPMKFDEPTIRRRSLENLIGYSIYLSTRMEQN